MNPMQMMMGGNPMMGQGMNPLQLIQQLQGNKDPMGALKQMFGNDPKFQRALEMAEGKTPEQLQQTVKNLFEQRGMNFDEQMKPLKQFIK